MREGLKEGNEKQLSTDRWLTLEGQEGWCGSCNAAAADWGSAAVRRAAAAGGASRRKSPSGAGALCLPSGQGGCTGGISASSPKVRKNIEKGDVKSNTNPAHSFYTEDSVKKNYMCVSITICSSSKILFPFQIQRKAVLVLNTEKHDVKNRQRRWADKPDLRCFVNWSGIWTKSNILTMFF